jgi:hypothetical protein
MMEIISEAFNDTAKTAPLLLAIYIGIELFEYKFGGAVIAKVKKAGAWGPLAGAVAGIFPQCGFSVIATALYTQRLVTIGTLLAVYLSTSDEALPILFSRPDKAGIVLPLIATKFFIALIFGCVIDLVFRQTNRKTLEHIHNCEQGIDDLSHHHETALEMPACCGHNANSASKKFTAAEILVHPLTHTLKIFIFIFLASIAINFSLEQVGKEAIAGVLTANWVLGPVLAALIGLMPNCAASVAITELFIQGMITYGAAVAGLCASGGLGLLVLAKEEKNKRNIAMVIGLLLGISVFAGLLIQYLMSSALLKAV